MSSLNQPGKLPTANQLEIHSRSRKGWRAQQSSREEKVRSPPPTLYNRKDVSCSSQTTTEISLDEETCDSLSADEEESGGDVLENVFGTNVPKLSLPTLYEDGENPVSVKITCGKCLDIETVLRNFTDMHMRAFSTCKNNREQSWEYLTHWNRNLLSTLETFKSHLIGEFIGHIDQAPLSEFKEEHDFRVQFTHYRLLFTHMSSMEDRVTRRKQQLYCSIKNNNDIGSDKMLKDLHQKISSSRIVLKQIEEKIRCIANNWDCARSGTNLHGLKPAIFTKEDYMFNRLSNIFTCINFLEKEAKFYEGKIQDSTTTPKRFLPRLQLKVRPTDSQCPKPCNVKRRLQNSVKRKLPSSIAHLYPFAKSEHMDDIHASWYRTFLRPEDVRKEISKQRDTNLRVLTDIKQLKNEIHHLKTQIKMKEFVEESVKCAKEDVTMFPEKSGGATTAVIEFSSLI